MIIIALVVLALVAYGYRVTLGAPRRTVARPVSRRQIAQVRAALVLRGQL